MQIGSQWLRIFHVAKAAILNVYVRAVVDFRQTDADETWFREAQMLDEFGMNDHSFWKQTVGPI